MALTAPWHILLQTAINVHESTAAAVKKKKKTEPVNWEILPDVALPHSSTTAMCTGTDMCNVNELCNEITIDLENIYFYCRSK